MAQESSYYAVIFTSTQTENTEGYDAMAYKMEALAKQQPGYLGMDHARSEVGITVSYWKNLQDIKSWKENQDHLFAQKQGREKWYSNYTIRICRVEREYSFEK